MRDDKSFQVETWLTLFALRGIWKRVVFRFKIHDCCALTSRKFQDVDALDGDLAWLLSGRVDRSELTELTWHNLRELI